MPTSYFLNNGIDEREVFAICERWEAIQSYYSINFRLGLLLGFRKENHGQECTKS